MKKRTILIILAILALWYLWKRNLIKVPPAIQKIITPPPAEEGPNWQFGDPYSQEENASGETTNTSSNDRLPFDPLKNGEAYAQAVNSGFVSPEKNYSTYSSKTAGAVGGFSSGAPSVSSGGK